MYKDGLVSIIMPSYNTEAYIGEAIESVLAQTYSDWELLIVDDCSSDNTAETVSRYSDSRIRFIVKERNTGAAESRNIALRAARGEWIAFLDSDDMWDRNKLEKQIAFMREGGYRFSCTYSRNVDEDSSPLGVIDTSPAHITAFGMALYNWIGCLTAMYHAPTIGLIQAEDLKKRNDYALWLKVIKKADCYCLNEVLGSYRVRKKSVSHDSLGLLIKAHYTLQRRCCGHGPAAAAILAAVNIVFGAARKIFLVKKVGRGGK